MNEPVDNDLLAEHEAAVARAIDAMRATLFDVVRLDDHAAAGMYSRYHFHRVFRQVTGTTPARFLAGLRMQRAKQLLAATEHTVTTISGLVGYESLGTFTTQFGRLVGTSPGRFRQLVRRCAERRLQDLEIPHPETSRTSTAPVLCHRSTAVAGLTTFVGFFPAGLPVGSPAGFAMLPHLGPDLLAKLRRPDQAATTVAVAVPGDTLLARLADGTADLLVGPATAPVCDDLTPDVLHLHLRPGRTVDPPIVSAAVVQYLAEHAR